MQSTFGQTLTMTPENEDPQLSQNVYLLIWALASIGSLLILIRFF